MDGHFELECVELLFDSHGELGSEAVAGRWLGTTVICYCVVGAIDGTLGCPDQPAARAGCCHGAGSWRCRLSKLGQSWCRGVAGRLLVCGRLEAELERLAVERRKVGRQRVILGVERAFMVDSVGHTINVVVRTRKVVREVRPTNWRAVASWRCALPYSQLLQILIRLNDCCQLQRSFSAYLLGYPS